MLTSIGCVGTSFLTLRINFSFGSDCKRDRQSKAAIILCGMCAIVKLNCITKSHAFHSGGAIFQLENSCH